jgi:RimJ/RimL family protein N-acetyltransferase
MIHSTANVAIPRLETERLLLREYRMQDFEAFAAAQADPEWGKYLGVSDRRNAFRAFGHQTGLWTLQGCGFWMCELKESKAPVGTLGAFFREGWPEMEIGWTTFRPFWGKGYAHEGARAAIRYAFEERKEKRVTALITDKNAPSIKLAEKLGMKRDSIAKIFDEEVQRFALARPA